MYHDANISISFPSLNNGNPITVKKSPSILSIRQLETPYMPQLADLVLKTLIV